VSEARVVFEVRELAPGYFTYDVAIRPADDLPTIRQASGAFRCEHLAELAAGEAVALIGVRLARMGAAPLPVHRVGLSPRDRARSRVAHRAGAALAIIVSAAIVGAVLGCAFSVVDHLIG
jgi:hypothetical protein